MSGERDTTSLLDVAAETLALVLTLSQLPERPAADVLRARAVERLDRFEGAARSHGFGEDDIADSLLVLCAFLDEVVAQVRGREADAWGARPLARERCGTSDPDTAHALRLDVLLAAQPERIDALELYAACLLLGHAGAFAADLETLTSRTEAALAAVAAHRGAPPSFAHTAVERA